MLNILDIFKTNAADAFEPKSVSGYEVFRPGDSGFKRILDYSINNRLKSNNNSERSVYGYGETKSRIEEQRKADAKKRNDSEKKVSAADENSALKFFLENKAAVKKTGTDKQSGGNNTEAIKNNPGTEFSGEGIFDEEKISTDPANKADKIFMNSELYELLCKINDKFPSESEKFSDSGGSSSSAELLLNLINEISEAAGKRGIFKEDIFKEANVRQAAAGQIPELNRVLLEKLAELKNLLDKNVVDSGTLSGRWREAVNTESDLIRNIENTLRAIQNGSPEAHESRESAIKNLAAGINDLLKVLKEAEKSNRLAEKSSDRSGGLNFGFIKNDSGSSTLRADALRSPSSAPNIRENFGSLLDQARMVVKDGKNASFIMNLYPRELGMVRMSLGLENGVLSGRFIVENADAKDALLANLSLMKDQLEKEGLDVGSFQVDIGAKEQQMKSEDENQLSALDLSILTEEASSEYENMSVLGHEGHIDLVI